MSERRLYLDRGLGETRGVVTLDGRPERLLLLRDDDDPRVRLGARCVARVARVEAAIGAAFLDLGAGAEAILPFKPDGRPVEGQALEIELRSEPRQGKLAAARVIGPAQGAPRLLIPPLDLADQLRAFAPAAQIVEGRPAREAADRAEAEALETVHELPGGGELAIEATRALTAVDIDLGARQGADAKRVTRQANLAAIGAAARLLRLKGLGGLIVIDLVGRGHDGAALLSAARTAFGPDNPGVALGPISRFGTLELTVPRRTPPLHERLARSDGTLSDRALAQRLIRRLESEAESQPGARLVAACAPGVGEAAAPFAPRLAERFGGRFSLSVEPGFARDRIEVAAT